MTEDLIIRNLIHSSVIMGKDRFVKQLNKVSKLFEKDNLYFSKKALKVAVKCHTGLRKDGYHELSHQLEIISILYPLFKYDRYLLDVMASSILLHDVVEDYPELYSFADLHRDFCHDIFDTVKRMTKTKSFTKTEKHYKKYYKKLSKRVFSVMAKLLDRIHNYESMIDQPLEFKIKYFKEVQEYMIPMAKKARREFPEYEQIITYLIRQLKVLTKFHVAILERETVFKS